MKTVYHISGAKQRGEKVRTFRCDDKLAAAVQRKAKKNKTSFSHEVREAIALYVRSAT